MPRRQRMYLPGVPAHVVQRGVNRTACFFTDADYRCYLTYLKKCLPRYRVRLHAYVLMTNHVHLLMTPEDSTGISSVMALLGNHYVRHVNKSYGRTGTLWEGRHKASLVDADEYLLQCYRYIELNPVRANIVACPGGYRWSSYGHHVGEHRDHLITDHPIYRGLDRSADARYLYYRGLIDERMSPSQLDAIRTAIRFDYPLGNQRFRDTIERMLDRSIGYDRTGRPAETDGQN